MVKMVSLKQTKADRKHGDDPMGAVPSNEPDGLPVRLEHHHIMKMMGNPLPHGSKVEFGGRGEVTETGTHDTPDGPRHHMTITLHRAGVEPTDETPEEARQGLRGDLEKAAAQKMQGKPSNDKKLPEKKGG